jgi:hypothetical protein
VDLSTRHPDVKIPVEIQRVDLITPVPALTLLAAWALYMARVIAVAV